MMSLNEPWGLAACPAAANAAAPVCVRISSHQLCCVGRAPVVGRRPARLLRVTRSTRQVVRFLSPGVWRAADALCPIPGAGARARKRPGHPPKTVHTCCAPRPHAPVRARARRALSCPLPIELLTPAHERPLNAPPKQPGRAAAAAVGQPASQRVPTPNHAPPSRPHFICCGRRRRISITCMPPAPPAKERRSASVPMFAEAARHPLPFPSC
jgi:hypothetical protein